MPAPSIGDAGWRWRAAAERISRVVRLRRILLTYPWVTATVAVGAASGVAALLGAGVSAHWAASIYCLVVAAVQAGHMIRRLLRGAFGLDVLAITAIVATIAVGDPWAGLVVVLMITGGEALEDYAAARARREVSALLARNPQHAHRIEPDGTVSDIPVEQVRPGDLLLVKTGETVPVDGTLEDEEGAFDESSLTGESLPVTRVAGDPLLSGSVSGQEAVRMRATAAAGDSQYQQIVALVQAASDSRAPMVRLADRYAVPFTAVAFAIAGIAWAVSGEAVRFAEVLVVATPCPLLIAAPVAFIGGMSRAARNGVIVKSGGTLEQLARVRSAAFDKTGTLTHGRPRVERVVPFGDDAPDEVLALAAAAEQFSSHVLADAIVSSAPGPLPDVAEVTEEPGHGVVAQVSGRRVVVGKLAFVAEHCSSFAPVPLEPGEMSVFVAVDGRPAAQILLRDEVRGNARDTLRELAALGVARTVMLTGDAEPTARFIAEDIGVDDVRAGLLPAQKVAAVQALPDRPVMMVGDGVNDAPVLAAADVGVAMGAKGSTAASESADVVIMVDDLSKTPVAIDVARRTVRVAVQSIWVGIALSVVLMIIAAFGVIPAIVGATLQEVVDLISILNGLRAVRDVAPRAARPEPVPA